jgi:hypothetical protein
MHESIRTKKFPFDFDIFSPSTITCPLVYMPRGHISGLQSDKLNIYMRACEQCRFVQVECVSVCHYRTCFSISQHDCKDT